MKLYPSHYEAYLREIVESGGTPSVHELSKKAAELSVLDFEVSLLRKAVNTFADTVSRKINGQDESKTVKDQEDQRKEKLSEI